MKDERIEYLGITCIKRPAPMVAPDMYCILQQARKIWNFTKMSEDERYRANALAEACRAEKPFAPQLGKRLYLTTDLLVPVIIAHDLSDKAFSFAKDNLRPSHFDLFDQITLQSFGNECFMAWLFEDEKLTVSFAMESYPACTLMLSYSRENLVSSNRHRPNWGLPRV